VISLASSRIVVLSPHLDDAIFSLGATISAASRSGIRPHVVTVFAGDPDSHEPAGWWDRATGFATFGEAVRERRHEDRRACTLVGATHTWLPFVDAQYAPERDEDAVWNALVSATNGAQAVLVPGFPLVHTDHEWLTRLVLRRTFPGRPLVGLYVEQPYAWRRGEKPRRHEALADLVEDPPPWRRSKGSTGDRRAKRRAIQAYSSQLLMFGREPVLRISLYEALHGGEVLAWLPSRNGSLAHVDAAHA
jgi:LmbE family N-acetylglucosaminyl deacetylase